MQPRRNLYLSDPAAQTILAKLPARRMSEVITLLLLASDLNPDPKSRELAKRKLQIVIDEL